MIDWVHAGPAIVASFLASSVEFVEALTIVLAVGTVRGWRPALAGTAAGALFLTILVAIFGPALKQIPLGYLQLVVGVLLLLFGIRWLRKAILRASGVIGLHDEEAIYNRQTNNLRAEAQTSGERFDLAAAAVTFKAVTLEGLEVVFIVIATGSVGNMLVPASLAAAAAGVLIILLGVALHRPLSRIPENTLKYAVGLILSAFGVFWIGEGLGYPWPGEDWSVVALFVGFLAASMLGIALSRRAAAAPLVSAGDAS